MLFSQLERHWPRPLHSAAEDVNICWYEATTNEESLTEKDLQNMATKINGEVIKHAIEAIEAIDAIDAIIK